MEGELSGEKAGELARLQVGEVEGLPVQELAGKMAGLSAGLLVVAPAHLIIGRQTCTASVLIGVSVWSIRLPWFLPCPNVGTIYFAWLCGRATQKWASVQTSMPKLRRWHNPHLSCFP